MDAEQEFFKQLGRFKAKFPNSRRLKEEKQSESQQSETDSEKQKEKTTEAPGDNKKSAADFSHTDMGNAERFAAYYHDTIRWCEKWKSWLIYDGKRWGKDEDNSIVTYAIALIRKMHAGAFDERDPQASAYAVKSASAGKIDAMLRLAKGALSISPVVFNRDAWLFNCANGTLDLRTYQLRPHAASDYITLCIPTQYKLDASCPKWERAIQLIFNEDEEMIAFIQQALGMSLSGHPIKRGFFVCHGGGDNGKTTILESVRRVLADYAGSAKIETFQRTNRTGASEDIASFYGKRLITTSEIESGSKLNASFMKNITGGEAIPARDLFEKQFEFIPEAAFWFAVNDKPVIDDATKGMWSRVIFIPFEATFYKTRAEAPDDEHVMNHNMQEELKGESEGILAWLVQGHKMLQKRGGVLELPAKVINATRAYREDMDSLGDFINDKCETGPDKLERASWLFTGFKKWCEDSGERGLAKISPTTFGRMLEQRGYIKKQARHLGVNTKCYVGIQLKKDDVSDVSDFVSVSKASQIPIVDSVSFQNGHKIGNTETDLDEHSEEWVERLIDFSDV